MKIFLNNPRLSYPGEVVSDRTLKKIESSSGCQEIRIRALKKNPDPILEKKPRIRPNFDLIKFTLNHFFSKQGQSIQILGVYKGIVADPVRVETYPDPTFKKKPDLDPTVKKNRIL